MKKLVVAVLFLLALASAGAAQNTATVSANLSFLTTNPAFTNVRMVMSLVNCGGNVPRIKSGL
jgi:hypothetical protein